MNWDVSLFRAINGLAGQSPFVDWLMLAVGDPSNLTVPVGCGLVFWLWKRRREALLGVIVLVALIVLADFLGARVKDLVGRERPCIALQDVHTLTSCGKTRSFPSNHAINTAAVATFFILLYPASAWVTVPLVSLIGFSRVYGGGHYVTDVLGGWMIGVTLAVGAAWFFKRWVVPKYLPAASHQT